MMCPWAARIGARRSLRPAYDVLTDPLQSSECLDRLSRAAVAKIASIAVPPPCDRIQISREIWIRSQGGGTAMDAILATAARERRSRHSDDWRGSVRTS